MYDSFSMYCVEIHLLDATNKKRRCKMRLYNEQLTHIVTWSALAASSIIRQTRSKANFIHFAFPTMTPWQVQQKADQ